MFYFTLAFGSIVLFLIYSIVITLFMSALDNIENGINGLIYSKFDEKELANNLENIIVKNINFENLILNSIKIKNNFNYRYQQIILDCIIGK